MYPSGIDPYSAFFDGRGLDDSQRESFKRNTLTEFSTGLHIFLFLITGGLFTTIYFGILHGRLPKIKNDDPSTGKAIGFLFIPVFNYYWVFFFYLRLVDRLNLQLKLRGLHPEVSKGYWIWALVSSFLMVPVILVTEVLALSDPDFIGLFLCCFCGGYGLIFLLMILGISNVQNAVNLIARTNPPAMMMGHQGVINQPVYQGSQQLHHQQQMAFTSHGSSVVSESTPTVPLTVDVPAPMPSPTKYKTEESTAIFDDTPGSCPSCNADSPSGAAFCPMCGGQLH